MTPEQRTLLLCSIIPANKPTLQELSQLIGIKLLTSVFFRNFGQMPVLPPPAHAHVDSYDRNFVFLLNF